MRRLVRTGGRWALGEGDGPAWIRTGGASEDQLTTVSQNVGMHPLSMEDVMNPRQRPKVEDYPDHTFVVARIPRGTDPEEGWQQVGIWLFADTVVTASPAPIPELDVVEQRIQERPAWAPDVGMLWYRILDALVDSWFPFMATLEDEVEEAEDAAVEKPTQEVLVDIRQVKHTVSKLRKLLIPMREAMMSLERNEHPNVPDTLSIYLRDISDHTIRLAERLDHVREVSLIAQESWNSALANQQNTVMKRLTVVAALLLVPSLFAGLGGMNFGGFPEWEYWPVTGAILGFVVVGMLVAVWRKWL